MPDPGTATALGPGEERLTGERYGRYQLLERIGKGGMAEVYRAVTEGVEGFRRVFVVKRIRPEKADSPDAVQMFCDEARVSAVLNHPNIVQVYDFGLIAGSYFLAMEHLHGHDLSSIMRALRAARALMPTSVAAFVAQQVATGLFYAHTLKSYAGERLQIVHRDVTPSNIMLLWSGGVKILDFGIARATNVVRHVELPNGRVKGKLSYLSPEQVRLQALDGRSDIFSLGVVLWEMITGHRLFSAADEFQTMRNVLGHAVPPPSQLRPACSPALDRVVARALERDRAKRYQTAQAMADDLEEVLQEARYRRHEVPHLLRQLFGEEPSEAVPDRITDAAVTGETGASGDAALPPADVAGGTPTGDSADRRSETRSAIAAQTPRVTLPGPLRAQASSGDSMDGIELTDAATFAEPGHRGRRVLGAVAGVVLVACFAWAGAKAYDRHVRGRAVPVAPRSAAVTLTIDSHPTGADVHDPAGRPLGATPLRVSVPRSTEHVRFKLRKRGYEPLAYTVVPDADRAVLLDLEPLDGAR